MPIGIHGTKPRRVGHFSCPLTALAGVLAVGALAIAPASPVSATTTSRVINPDTRLSTTPTTTTGNPPAPTGSNPMGIPTAATVGQTAPAAPTGLNSTPAMCGSSNQCSPPLKWWGAPIQHNPVIYLVFWGPLWQTDSTGRAGALQSLYSDLSSSGWGRVPTQYYDSSSLEHDNATLAGVWTDPVAPTPNLASQAIANEANHARNMEGWSDSYDTQYVIVPERGATYASNGNCGWHDYVGSNSPVEPNSAYVMTALRYIVDNDPNCSFYGNGSGLNAMTVAGSHEFAESATDPNVGGGWCEQTGCGSTQYSEIGDFCSETGTPALNGVWVTYLWDNISGSCVTSISPTYSYKYNGAQFVNSPYPEAIGHDYWVALEIINTGNIAWDTGITGIVRLETSNGQCSGFYDPDDWANCGTILIYQNASTNGFGPILPGQVAYLSWPFDPGAGVQPQNYVEYFDPYAVGVGFLSTNALNWQNNVGFYGATYVSQQDALGGAYIAGRTYTEKVTFKNTGTCPWFGFELMGLRTSHPIDRTSAFADSTWSAPTRPDVVRAEVDPGQTYTFQYSLKVPLLQKAGSYAEYFDPVADGEVAFSTNYHVSFTVV